VYQHAAFSFLDNDANRRSLLEDEEEEHGDGDGDGMLFCLIYYYFVRKICAAAAAAVVDNVLC
jgi:hypothetical protein